MYYNTILTVFQQKNTIFRNQDKSLRTQEYASVRGTL